MATRTAKTKQAAYRRVDVIDVYLWGKHIGAVALDPAWGYYAFEYTKAFAAQGIQPSPLHMPVRAGEPYIFTDLPAATYKHLPAMLAAL